MKTSSKLLFVMLCIVILFSCSSNTNKSSKELKSVDTETQEVKTISENFIVEFTGEYKNVIDGPESGCEDPYNCLVVVEFKGTGSIGDFIGIFNFCACGPEGEYAPTESYMIDTNGDSLIVSCAGKVIPGKLVDHPEHVTSYWKDPFKILGGTGKFEGATGKGMTNDYNSSTDANSHHNWEGEITLLKTN